MHAHQNVIEFDIDPLPGRSHVAAADDGLSAFLSARPRLLGIAYRMLGSAAEAEDVVQDVWVRWQVTARGPVRNPMAFLITATTRLAINVLQSARVRRETSGALLPEPIDSGSDPRLKTERDEALAAAVRLLLEKLSPVERAAYVLREAFSHPYRKIAAVLGIEEANARQLVTRARARVAGDRRAPAPPAEQRRLLTAFVAAARTENPEKLERLFAADAAALTERRPARHAGGSAWQPPRRHVQRLSGTSAPPLRRPGGEPDGACL